MQYMYSKVKVWDLTLLQVFQSWCIKTTLGGQS